MFCFLARARISASLLQKQNHAARVRLLTSSSKNTIETTGINLDMIHSDNSSKTKSTKIVCTIGPSCWSLEGVLGLIDNGMNLARLNFSHGDHETHLKTVNVLRMASTLRPDSHVGIMVDIKGPGIRTGKLDPSLNGKLTLTKGDELEMGIDTSRLCTQQYISCSYQSLPRSVKRGGKILLADGSVVLEVLECSTNSVRVRVLNSATIGERKNVNLPGAIIDLPSVGPKDISDLTDFVVPNGIDFVAASFTRTASDIRRYREVLGEAGKHVKIIAKIENQEGLANFDEILQEVDGIMVARGDLGMEIPLEKVFLAQKMMIRKCNAVGKPVITATQMLESIINSPRPTRAECSDVANAVLDGTDCVMLSGETAIGQFPNEAVKTMADVCKEAESIIDYYRTFDRVRQHQIGTAVTALESLASSAVKTASDMRCPFIIVASSTGHMARLVAKYFPSQPILVLTRDAMVARQCSSVLANCRSFLVTEQDTNQRIIGNVINLAKERGLCNTGDPVITLYGPDGIVAGQTNKMKLYIVQ